MCTLPSVGGHGPVTLNHPCECPCAWCCWREGECKILLTCVSQVPTPVMSDPRPQTPGPQPPHSAFLYLQDVFSVQVQLEHQATDLEADVEMDKYAPFWLPVSPATYMSLTLNGQTCIQTWPCPGDPVLAL